MDDASEPAEVMEPRLWKKTGWIARVIKNEDDDGWAVEMTRHGDAEPALVGPWTMGRDKKNPKPLDQSAFTTLIKTASEVLRRHEQALRARLHREVEISGEGGRRIRVELDVAQDEDDPHAMVAAFDAATGELIRRSRMSPTFTLSGKSALRFVQGGDG
jgi:hypothetical protein